MRRRHRSLLSLPTVLAFLSGSPARATVIAPLDLAQLVARADRIAVARVEDQKAQWTDDRSAIITHVTLRVERPVKGGLRAGEIVEVLREGGEVDGIGMRVEGAARFTTGEQALVFLERRGSGTWTVGMAQGKMRVDLVDGKPAVTRDLAGLILVGGDTRKDRSWAGARRPLDDVLHDIAALVRARPGASR